jgi:hypothetical protein
VPLLRAARSPSRVRGEIDYVVGDAVEGFNRAMISPVPDQCCGPRRAARIGQPIENFDSCSTVIRALPRHEDANRAHRTG